VDRTKWRRERPEGIATLASKLSPSPKHNLPHTTILPINTYTHNYAHTFTMFNTKSKFLFLFAACQLLAKTVMCAPAPIPNTDTADQINNSYSGSGGHASGGGVTTNAPNPKLLLGGMGLLDLASGKPPSFIPLKHVKRPTQETEAVEEAQNLDPPCLVQAPSLSPVQDRLLLTPMAAPAAQEARHTRLGTHIAAQEASPKEGASQTTLRWLNCSLVRPVSPIYPSWADDET
jgi:hypothetical protein